MQLGSNRIRQLPSGVDGWKSLLHLGLRNNDLQLLPRELGWLQHLEKIALSGNMKLSLPKAVHGAGCR
jgi:leucine-rich repeat protein SHOC2